MPGHQGLNVPQSLCRIVMEYYLLNAAICHIIMAKLPYFAILGAYIDD